MNFAFKLLLVSSAFFSLANAPTSSPTNLPTHSPIKAAAEIGGLFAIDSKIPEAIESDYSLRLPKVLKAWPPKDVPVAPLEGNPIWIRAIRTPGKDSVIGFEKRTFISAPIDRVASMIEDFENYPSRDDGLEWVKIKSREKNKVMTSWERKAPVKLLFIPLSSKIDYEQTYLIDRTVKDRVVFRFQLVSSDSANASDGLVVLEGKDQSTILTSFDFYDGKWGLLAGIAMDTIWHEIIKRVYHGDLMLKNQAEHPDWNPDQIKKSTEQTMDDYFRSDAISFLASPDLAGL